MSFVIYDFGRNTKKGEETRVAVLENGKQLLKHGGVDVPIVVDGNSLAIDLGEAHKPDDVLIMGNDGNWHQGSEFMRLGVDSVTIRPKDSRSVVVLGESHQGHFHGVHFER